MPPHANRHSRMTRPVSVPVSLSTQKPYRGGYQERNPSLCRVIGSGTQRNVQVRARPEEAPFPRTWPGRSGTGCGSDNRLVDVARSATHLEAAAGAPDEEGLVPERNRGGPPCMGGGSENAGDALSCQSQRLSRGTSPQSGLP